MRNFTEIVAGEPFRAGVRCKRGSKIKRGHVRVSHLLMCFLFVESGFPLKVSGWNPDCKLKLVRSVMNANYNALSMTAVSRWYSWLPMHPAVRTQWQEMHWPLFTGTSCWYDVLLTVWTKSKGVFRNLECTTLMIQLQNANDLRTELMRCLLRCCLLQLQWCSWLLSAEAGLTGAS